MVKTIGDGMPVEFTNVLDALRVAAAVQREMGKGPVRDWTVPDFVTAFPLPLEPTPRPSQYFDKVSIERGYIRSAPEVPHQIVVGAVRGFLGDVVAAGQGAAPGVGGVTAFPDRQHVAVDPLGVAARAPEHQ